MAKHFKDDYFKNLFELPDIFKLPVFKLPDIDQGIQKHVMKKKEF